MRLPQGRLGGYDMQRPNRIARKTAQPMSEIVAEYIRAMKLASGLNVRRVFEAWEQASGAGSYTTKMFYRGGRLHVTLNSSVARNHLSFQKDMIIMKMNQLLRDDELFVKDDPATGYVSEIILK